MSTATEHDEQDAGTAVAEHDEQDTGTTTAVEVAETEPKRKLTLDVQITDVGPCKKHLKVAIPRDDVEHQYEESLVSFKNEAAVPGFRPGHAPRTLVQKRFRKEVAGQVKQSLLLACMEQLDEEYKLNPITQPKLDVDAINLPDDGPMTFEMDVEVQPDFKLPAYKALRVQRPVKEIAEADVEAQFKTFLERYAQLVPKFEGGAEIGDFITADLTFHQAGQTLNQAKEITFRLQPELRFQDGRVPNVDKALLGVRPEQKREATALVGTSSANPALRGQSIGVTFDVLDLKTLRLPEVNQEFLRGIGFDSIDELKLALRGVLERKFEFQQRQSVRKSILDQLLAETPFDLPVDLVAREERNTLRRQVNEMRQAGSTEAEIRAREAELRANAHEQTLLSLKEFFLLSKVADAEDIKVDDDDLEMEIENIAIRSDESPRRVRARIEKEGLGDGLMAQILENKTIDRILEYVKVEDVPMVEARAVETLDELASPEAPETEDEGEAPPPDA